MTQEELDALMNEGSQESENDTLAIQDISNEESNDSTQYNEESASEYGKIEQKETWPPPPPTKDNKVVEQLDDVTKDSEVKATQIFDKLEVISNEMMNIESVAKETQVILESQIKLMNTLMAKFPNIEVFKQNLAELNKAIANTDSIINSSLNSGDEIMTAMDIMQYQDIHRQKIERVINVMRALSRYMNSLFDSKVEDATRTSSAKHITGDVSHDAIGDSEIEALIASFGK